VVVEELEQGGDLEPSRLGPGAWIGIALAAVVAGAFLLSGPGGGGTDALPSITPPVQTFTAEPIPGPSVQSLVNDPGASLNIGLVCPAITDGRRSLSVSFELVNIGSTSVTVLGVKPLLPLAGLRPVGTTKSGGSCGEPGRNPTGGILFAGQKELFTMMFQLPKNCPKALPVQASVRLRVNQMVGTTTVPVFSDLGSVEFVTCPSANPGLG
jgi:hypothetical protein